MPQSRDNSDRHTRQEPTDRPASWCLAGIADSRRTVRESERRIERERGHAPTLYEVIEDLMERQHLATPFTAPTPRADRSQ